jgi:hypothetical protein
LAQLIISGEVETNENGFIAIDDVSFTPSCSIDIDLILPTVGLSTDPDYLSSSTEKVKDDKKNSSSNRKFLTYIV